MINSNGLIFIICILYFSTYSSDSKAPYNAFDEKVTAAIKEAHNKQREELRTQKKSKKRIKTPRIPISSAGSINEGKSTQQHRTTRRCCPEWCGDFRFPIIFFCTLACIAGGASYCKETQSCLGFERSDDSANNSTVSAQALNSHTHPLAFQQPAFKHPRANQPSVVYKPPTIKLLLRDRRLQQFQFKKKK